METYIVTFSIFDHTQSTRESSVTLHYQGCLQADSPDQAKDFAENWVCENTGFGISDIDEIHVTAMRPGVFTKVSSITQRLPD